MGIRWVFSGIFEGPEAFAALANAQASRICRVRVIWMN